MSAATAEISDQVETPKDLHEKSPGDKEFTRWKTELEHAIKHFKDYQTRVAKILSKYRVEEENAKSSNATRRYNILWSVVSTLQPNLFMGMPKPHVDRRFNDSDKVARYGGMVLERCLTYANDSDDMNDAFSAATDDYILTGRGAVWSRYSPEFSLKAGDKKTPYANDNEVPKNAIKGQDATGKYYQEQEQVVEDDDTETDHIAGTDFLHSPVATWKHVTWIAKRVLMTRTDLVERFKDTGASVPLRYKPDGSKLSNTQIKNAEQEGAFLLAAVWEVWDKVDRRVLWLCLEHDQILDEKDDPLKLRNFFPAPRPLYDTTTSNTLIPVPMYKYFEDIANELDELTFRISLLTESMRVVGVYDATCGKLMKRITSEARENDMIEVKNWPQLSEKGGLQGVMQFLPIENIITVIEKLYKARAQLLQDLYEVTGISDIIRGSTDPRETAKAQSIKGQYASKRLARKQKAVARFAREHLEIQAEIICKHYDAETIKRISSAEQFIVDDAGQFDQALFDQVIDLLRSKPLRCYRIKIDNETLAGDDMKDHNEQVVNFLQQFGALMTATFPLAQQAPPLAKAIKEMTMMGIRSFPVARSVEGAIEKALEDMANNMPPPEQKEAAGKAGKSPEEIKIRMRELEIQEQTLGIQRQELLMKEQDSKRKFDLDMARLRMDGELRKLQIQTVRQNANENVQAKLIEGDAQRSHDKVKHITEIEDRHADRQHQAAQSQQTMQHDAMQADADRQQSAQQHQDSHSLETERSAAELAERRLDRESAAEDRVETRAQADRQHGDKMKVAEKAASAKAKSAGAGRK